MKEEWMTLDDGDFSSVFLQWEKLPAGEYSINTLSRMNGEGSVPFTFVAYASKEAVNIVGESDQ